LGKRILTALVAIPALFLLVIAGGRTGTALVVAVASYVGVKEFLALAPDSKNALEKFFAPFWGALTALCFLVSSETAPLAATAAGMVLFLVARAAKEGVGSDVLQSGFRVFAAWLYVPLSIGFAVTVRGNAWEPIVFLILLVIAGDSAAYFTGISLGRHRLAPSISPKKTIEGSVGGFVFTVATGYFLATVMRVPHSPVESMGIAALLNVAAQLGDLGESVLKRGAGVKDSGTFFPGHGGMLDRIDSFVPTLPIYAFILSVTGGLP
jgi:phosphatidate cytidylyltransferase